VGEGWAGRCSGQMLHNGQSLVMEQGRHPGTLVLASRLGAVAILGEEMLGRSGRCWGRCQL
jgi:hypothetical protein